MTHLLITLTSIKRRLARCVVSFGVAALVVPAAAAAAGTEHTVTQTTVSGTDAVPSDLRTETWLTDAAVHLVTTDVETGQVIHEFAEDADTSLSYSPGRGVVFGGRPSLTRSGTYLPPVQSLAEESAIIADQLAGGQLRVTGGDVVDGHAVDVLTPAGGWRSSDAGSSTTITVDQATRQLVRRVDSLPGGRFQQDERVVRVEHLPAAAPDQIAQLGRSRAAVRAAVSGGAAAPASRRAATRKLGKRTICTKFAYVGKLPGSRVRGTLYKGQSITVTRYSPSGRYAYGLAAGNVKAHGWVKRSALCA